MSSSLHLAYIVISKNLDPLSMVIINMHYSNPQLLYILVIMLSTMAENKSLLVGGALLLHKLHHHKGFHSIVVVKHPCTLPQLTKLHSMTL